MIIEYDLVGNEQAADVALTITLDGKEYLSKNLSLDGDIGKVTIGNSKKIYWDILKDFPKGINSQADWEIIISGNTVSIGNLMWQDNEEVKRIRKNWDDALTYCAKMSLSGFDTWRLPTKEELLSIVQKREDPTIGRAFKNIAPFGYWTSTKDSDGIGYVWSVYFHNGDAQVNSKDNYGYTRCVRNIHESK